jgi:hypothetical protein
MNVQISALLALFILILLGLVSLMIVLRFLFHRVVDETSEAIQESAPRALGIGLVNFIFAGAIALALLALGENTGIGILFVPAILLLAALAVAMTLGLASVSSFIGELVTPEQALWRKTAVGALLLTLACITPYVGWFFLLPYVVLIGMGAYVRSLYYRWRPVEEVAS